MKVEQVSKKCDQKKWRYLCLVFGDQLNQDSALWQNFDVQQDCVWMAEVRHESIDVVSSMQRTWLFFSAMRHFAEDCIQLGRSVLYHSIQEKHASFESALDEDLKTYSFRGIKAVLPGDWRVHQAISKFCETRQLPLEWMEDRHFISLPGEFSTWIKNKKQPRMEYWYRFLRKRTGWLMDSEGRPIGGKWNYDQANRQSFSKQGPVDLQTPIDLPMDAVTRQVRQDLAEHLPGLAAETETLVWPVTSEQAKAVFQDFIRHRLKSFGDYQDAMWIGEPWLFHSRLSTALNLKLLNPREVIESAIEVYDQGEVALNSIEGFVRQILGWREYVRGLYWRYRDQWSEMNALQADRNLPDFYWTGKTRMRCMKESIGQVLEYGYGHHIQRLMVTGLFSLLYGVRPSEVEAWYLAMYVDAVSWVEVPNTLGMSQFADGGIVGSKPYIASGAYIDRMSNYCQGCVYHPKQAETEQACPFTTFYWHFVDRHFERLQGHPRLGMQAVNWRNKPEQQQAAIRKRAEWLFENIQKV